MRTSPETMVEIWQEIAVNGLVNIEVYIDSHGVWEKFCSKYATFIPDNSLYRVKPKKE